MKKKIQKYQYAINDLWGVPYAVLLSAEAQKQELKDKIIPRESEAELLDFIANSTEYNVMWRNKKTKELGYQSIYCLTQEDIDKILLSMNKFFSDHYSYAIAPKPELPVKKVRKTRTVKPQD